MYSLGYMDTTDSCAGPGTIIYLEHLQMMAHVRWVEFSETKFTCLSDNFQDYTSNIASRMFLHQQHVTHGYAAQQKS